MYDRQTARDAADAVKRQGAGRHGMAAAACLVLATALSSSGQGLRFGNHRDVKPPDYAYLRIGPFYSSLLFQQTFGYRYVRTTGTGTDFLFANHRGTINEDGSEFPLVTTLNTRNYLMLSRSVDVDMSLLMRYECYPLGTQDNDLYVDLSEEGIYGTFSSEIQFSPYLKGTAYDYIGYHTDYVDLRGLDDRYGGRKYKFFSNRVGFDMDWLLAKKQNVGLLLYREDILPQTSEFDDQKRHTYYESLVYQYALLPGLVVGARAGYAQNQYADPNRADTSVDDYSLFFNFTREEEGGLRVTPATMLKGRLGFATARNRGVLTSTNEVDSTTAVGELSLETRLTRDLSHTLSYTRDIRDSFYASYEVTDAYQYRLSWRPGLVSADAYTGVTRADPSNISLTDYDAWTTGADMTVPITHFMNLLLMTEYTTRKVSGSSLEAARQAASQDTTGDILFDPELLYDYNTWVSRIGTSLLLTKKIGFTTYYEHVERDSDAQELAYSRDIFSAVCSFSHRF